MSRKTQGWPQAGSRFGHDKTGGRTSTESARKAESKVKTEILSISSQSPKLTIPHSKPRGFPTDVLITSHIAPRQYTPPKKIRPCLPNSPTAMAPSPKRPSQKSLIGGIIHDSGVFSKMPSHTGRVLSPLRFRKILFSGKRMIRSAVAGLRTSADSFGPEARCPGPKLFFNVKPAIFL